MAAVSVIEDLPLPRLMASAKSPPLRTDCWIFSMARRWSFDHSRTYTSGKYVSQNFLKSRRHDSLRPSSPTAGSSPMSRPSRDRSDERRAASARIAS
jgi:hypothetical protein